MTKMMMGDEHDHAADDDVDAGDDDDDDEDGDDGDVCTLSRCSGQSRGNCSAGRGKRWQGEVKRREVQRAPPPEAGSRRPRWEAMTAVLLPAQAPGVFPHGGLWAAVDAVLLLLGDEERLVSIQSAQKVARAETAPKLEELCEGNALARHDVPRPARGRFTTSTMGGHDSLSLDSAGSGRFSS